MNGVMFRQQNRLGVCLPLRVRPLQHPVKAVSTAWPMNSEAEYTVTENVSSGGCYFYLAQDPPLGARLEIEITIPGDAAEAPFARVYCRGQVIRVDYDWAGQGSEEPRVGVAAAIERLHDVHIESIPAPARQSDGAAVA